MADPYDINDKGFVRRGLGAARRGLGAARNAWSNLTAAPPTPGTAAPPPEPAAPRGTRTVPNFDPSATPDIGATSRSDQFAYNQLRAAQAQSRADSVAGNFGTARTAAADAVEAAGSKGSLLGRVAGGAVRRIAPIAAPAFAAYDAATDTPEGRRRAGGNFDSDLANAAGDVGSYTLASLGANLNSAQDIGSMVHRLNAVVSGTGAGADDGEAQAATNDYMSVPESKRGLARRALEAAGLGTDEQAAYDQQNADHAAYMADRNRKLLAKNAIDAAFDFNAHGNAEHPDFSNVVGKSSTVADTSAAPQRRSAPQVDAGPGAAGYAAANVGNPDERGLQARLKDLDSALFDLSERGGGLNMRSKRELFGQLLGEKASLSKTGFEADNQRQLERGRLANEAGQANAQLAEAAAKRRSDVNQFNVSMGENVHQFDEGLTRKDRELNIQEDGAKAQRTYFDMLVKDAEAQRQADEYGLKRRGVQDAADTADVQATAKGLLESKAAPDYATALSMARQQKAVDLADTGQAIDTTPAVAGARDYMDQLSNDLGRDRGFFGRLVYGDNPFAADQVPNGANYPFEKVKIQPRGVSLASLDWVLPGSGDDYEAIGPEINGQRVKTTLHDPEAAREFQQRLDRAAAMRRSITGRDKNGAGS